MSALDIELESEKSDELIKILCALLEYVYHIISS
jgi:hypothetical protein